MKLRRPLVAALVIMAACGGGGGEAPTAFEWKLPPGFPEPRVPADNPMSTAKVELGRQLFYDARLSGNGSQACVSCHQPSLAFSDGRPVSVGSTGQSTPRGSMPLVNVAYNATQTWANPTLLTLEQQIAIPLFGERPVEMGATGNEPEILSRLAADPRYPDLFAAAFPEDEAPLGFPNVIRALASFLRTLISGNSAFDRFTYAGDRAALSESALRGMDLFFSERFECFHCHGGFNFSASVAHGSTAFAEQAFHNTGLYDLGGGAYPPGNRGVFEVTGVREDMGRFRPPTLRNVALTAPYMHDGSIGTLEEVIDFYAAGGRLIETGPLAGDGRRNPFKSRFVPGFSFTPQENADLLAFLNSLTDPSFVQNPAFGPP